MERRTTFLVLEDSAIDYDTNTHQYLFDSKEKAKAQKEKLIEKSGIRDEITDDWVCIDEEYYFEAYPDGEYCENHYVVYVQELEIK